ncbi:MAG: zinc ribbon domain-containing protein [Anaerolineae bacterium]|jgi:uncharacterized membrane protein YvbJ
MSSTYCPECGHQNPAEARFCMNCGHPLAGQPARAAQANAAPTAVRPGSEGTDWAGIVAALLAFLSLRRMSRKARGTAIVIAFFVLFFGCPMVCGFMAFTMEWAANLFQ